MLVSFRSSCLTIGAVLSLGSTIVAQSVFIDLGRGPVEVHVPASYDAGTPAPLLLLLHGYSSTGAGQESYVQLAPLADQLGFLYAHPDGTENPGGLQFWNATDACCNFFGSTVDDSGYLRALIEEIAAQLSVDASRIYIFGHSNGGFMAYRMACDHSDLVAAIISLAGATFSEPTDCVPEVPVHVLQIHGTLDNVIFYGGGAIAGAPYPGAVQSVETWVDYDGCDLVADTSLPPLDLDTGIPGAETLVSRYASNCSPGGSGELWTIVGGGHIPSLTSDFRQLVMEFFLDHPKSEDSFTRSDVTNDETVDLGDVIAGLDFLFGGTAVPCERTVDANDDESLDITDPIYLLAYLFANGSAPSPPFPECGPDPTPGDLSCEAFICP